MLFAAIQKTRKLECDSWNTRFILLSAALIKAKKSVLNFFALT